MSDIGQAFKVEYPGTQVKFMFKNENNLDYIASLVAQGGLANYEIPTPGVVVALMQEGSGIALDVGANTGILTLTMASANSSVHVCAFEPLESVRSVLKSNIAINPTLASRISVSPLGLSDRKGTATFYETINDVGMMPTSSSLELSHAEMIGSYREQTIETEMLDSWAATLGPQPIHFMKIDVEGHEYAVLNGGRETISRHRPFVVLEVLGKELESLNRFKGECGYLDFAIAPTSFRHCSLISFHPDAWNHVLCPAEKAGRVLQIARQLGLGVDII